jgi:hypothetical protein
MNLGDGLYYRQKDTIEMVEGSVAGSLTVWKTGSTNRNPTAYLLFREWSSMQLKLGVQMYSSKIKD